MHGTKEIREVSGSALILIAAVLFGVQTVFVHWGGSDGVIGGAARCLGLALMAALISRNEPSIKMDWRHWLVGLSSAACGYLFPAMYSYADTATAISIAYTGMLARPYFDWLLRRAPVTQRDNDALLLGLFGVVAVWLGAPNPGRSFEIGVLLAIGAAYSWVVFAAGHTYLGNPTRILVPANILGATIGFAYILLRGTSPSGWMPANLLIGVTASIAFLAFALGNPRVTPVRSALMSMIEIPVAIASAFFVLSETPNWLHGLGCSLIFGANVLAIYNGRRKE